MSADETEYVRGEFRYVITNPPWRSSLVTTFLRHFDKIHLSSRFTSLDRPKRGAFPHRRWPSRRVDHSSKPVPRLPKNFYDDAWLATLEEFELLELDIQPEYDLSLSPSVLRYATHCVNAVAIKLELFRLSERFRNVIDHKTRPLARDDPDLPPLFNPSDRQLPSSLNRDRATARRLPRRLYRRN
jgi:hypothetical protein